MRRSIQNLAVLWGKTKPIYEVLMAAQPGESAKWGQEISLLHKKHVHTAWCWHNMSADDKQELIRMNFDENAMKKIDAAIDEGLGLNETTKKVFILFGSQTGKAETYAKMVGTYAAAHNVTPVVATLNDGVNLLQRAKTNPEAVLIVTSTYGKGEIPANGQLFWDALKDDKLPMLAKIPYSVMGLGNSKNGGLFNNAARKIDAKIQEMGGTSLVPSALSCELQVDGHDAKFRPWKQSIWPALGAKPQQGAVDAVYKVTNTYMSVDDVQDAAGNDHAVRPGFFRATVHQNQLTSPKDFEPHQRLLTMRATTEEQRGNFGDKLRARIAGSKDHIDVLPKNSDDLTQRTLKRLGLTEPDQIVEVLPLPGAPASFFDGRNMKVHTILKEIVDLSSMPSRSTIELMARLATEEADKIRLMDLVDNHTPGSEYDKLSKGVFTVVDLLEMFPKLNINLAQLMSYVPHIVPRTYGVANDNTENFHEQLEIDYTCHTRSAAGKKHAGLCSGYMETLRAGDKPWIRFVAKELPDVMKPTKAL